MAKSTTIKVNGEPIDIDVKEQLTIQDLSDDMDRVAALMGFWGGIWAAAEAEKIETDAVYRKWRAQETKKIMEKNTKLAVDKIKALIESQEEFQVLKIAIARTIRNTTIAKSHYESFRTKAHILQSKGAMYRSEYENTNLKTKTQNQKNTTNDEKVAQMRATNQRKGE